MKKGKREDLSTEELKKQAIESLRQRGEKMPSLKIDACIKHIKNYKA
jgi:hypothetical protein